ncbi:DUF3883 domain-containing protein, partial [bacterium]|nr:DUF3883 domain-containing protein [bacterium]
NCVYMKRNGDIYDLAVEFSKVFGEIKGLDDFIMNIMSNIPNAENIMRVKNIEALPESEEEILKRVSKIKEIEIVEEAGKEKQLPESESKEVYPVEDETETEKITQIPAETSTQDSSRLVGKTVIPTDEDILDETEEKEWAPEFSPEDVPINVGEYIPEEGIKVSEKGTKSIDKKPPIRRPTLDKERTPPTEVLSKKAKEDIGRWGEKYTSKCIKDEMTKKYPDTSLVDTEQGFRLEKDGDVIVEVVWLNKNGESGQHYDIKIIENGEEIFIEVKSTKEYGKAWFSMSKDQWKLMKEKGDKFYIYRVYGAGTQEAKVEKLPNPAKLWKEGHIDAYPLGIEI